MGTMFSDIDVVEPIPIDIYKVYSRHKWIRFAKAYIFHRVMCSSDLYRNLSDAAKTNLLIGIEVGCLKETVRAATAAKILLNWRDVQFGQLYDEICMKIAANLNMTGMCKNEYLLPKVINGEIPARQLGGMSSRELMPQFYVNFNLEARVSDADEYLTTTSIYTCGKCGHRKCRTTVMQLRALDEGSNIKIECQNCRHTWII